MQNNERELRNVREMLTRGRSIPLCRNDMGELLLPCEMEGGKPYNCYDLTCTAHFYKRRLQDKDIAVIEKGGCHTGCFCAAENKRKTVLDIAKTVSGGLASAIMRPPVRQRPVPGQDGDGREKEIKQPKTPRTMKDIRRSMRGLNDLERSGITELHNCELEKGVMTVDLFVSQNNAHYVMQGRRDFLARGMEVLPEGAFDNSKTLRFLLKENRASKNVKFRKKILDMVFASQEEYELARDKVFLRNMMSEVRSPYVPRYRGTVYIYGVWRASSESACKAVCKKSCTTNNSVCTGHQVSDGINADTQIYIPRGRKAF